jgi:hypothetical protein
MTTTATMWTCGRCGHDSRVRRKLRLLAFSTHTEYLVRALRAAAMWTPIHAQTPNPCPHVHMSTRPWRWS